MPKAEIQELGLGTIEQPAEMSVPYTEYWTDVYPDAMDAMGIATRRDKSRMQRMGRFISDVTECVIRGAELVIADDYHDFLPSSKASWVGVIDTWDRALGSLNPMRDGQGDLLRAAGLLMSRNVSGGVEKYQPVSDPNPRNVYKAFTSLWRNNPVGEQKPTSSLMVAAQLVHKAALIDPDDQRQTRLLGMAESMYERLESDAPARWEVGKLAAAEYAADIRFHLGLNELEMASRRGDKSARSTALKWLYDTMHERATALGKLYGGLFVGDRDHQNHIAGRMFEEFVSLALRDSVLTQWLNDKSGPRFEVRKAFTHEDELPYGLRLRPKPAFDLVVKKRSTDGTVSTTPVQLKLGARSGSMKRGRAEYLEGIAYLRGSGIRPDHILAAAESLAAKYSKQGRHESRPTPSLVRLQSRLGELLLAA